MSGGHDKNTTYIIYNYNIGPSFEDLGKNVYVLASENSQTFTYTNSEKLLVPTFSNYNPSSPTTTSPYNDMVEVVLGDNIEAGICKFSFCKYLESVTINYRNDRISIGAFGFCQSLTSVTIPNTIRSIEEGAFYACNKLPTFNFDNITYIGFSAFQDCGTFTTLQFNNNSYFFVSNSFDNCTKLTSISFNDKCVGVIQPNAFVSTGITNVTLPPNMLWTPNPQGSQYEVGSFPLGCDVSGGRIGSGVVGNFKLTSIGTDSTDRVFTATATTSGTASGVGDTNADALNQLLSNATADFIFPTVSGFASQYGSSGSTRHTLDFTLVG